MFETMAVRAQQNTNFEESLKVFLFPVAYDSRSHILGVTFGPFRHRQDLVEPDHVSPRSKPGPQGGHDFVSIDHRGAALPSRFCPLCAAPRTRFGAASQNSRGATRAPSALLVGSCELFGIRIFRGHGTIESKRVSLHRLILTD